MTNDHMEPINSPTGPRRFRRLHMSLRTKKIVGSTGLTLALLGAGLGSSFATGAFSSNAAKQPTPAAATNTASTIEPAKVAKVTNLTPFTWTLVSATDVHWDHAAGAFGTQGPPEVTWRAPWSLTKAALAPPQTVAPGQTFYFTNFAGNYDGSDHMPEVRYKFVDDASFAASQPDGQGNVHIVQLFTADQRTNGVQLDIDDPFVPGHDWVGGLSMWAYNGDFSVLNKQGTNAANSILDTNWKGIPTGVNSVAAVMKSGTISIDAKANPEGAAAIVNGVFDQLPADQQKAATWRPNPDTVEVGPTGTNRVSSLVTNWSSHPADVKIGGEASTGQSTDLEEEVSTKVSTDVLVASASATVSLFAGQKWGSSDGIKYSVSGTVKPGRTGWIVLSTQTGSVTGNLSFTTDGVTYKLTNLTLSQSGVKLPQTTAPATNFYFTSQPAALEPLSH